MSTFRNIAMTLAALAVLAFFGTCTWITIDVNAKVLVPLEAALNGAHVNHDDGYLVLGQRFLQNTTAAANAVKQTMQDTNRIAKAQEGPTLALTQSSVRMLDEGTQTITKLNGSVDGLNDVIADVRTNTLPRVNTGVDQLGGLIGDLRPTAQALTGVVTESTNVVKTINVAVGHADALIADPDFRAIAGNLNAASLNMNNLAAHMNGAATNVEKTTEYIRNDFSPKHLPLWQSIIQTAVPYGLGSLVRILVPTTVTVSGAVKTQAAQ